MSGESSPPRPDVHLAYARPDAGLARAVHRFLSKAGARVSYPDRAANEGRAWLGAADGWARRSQAHIVLLTDRTPPGWQRAEFDFSARSRARNPKLQTIPLVRAGYTAGDFDEVLDRFDAIHLPEDQGQLEVRLRELVERISAPSGLPAMPSHEATHPYPWLRPYGVNEGRIFFGRDREVDEAVARLGVQPDGTRRRWLRIGGPPGAGKTSLARAGVVPAIVRGIIEDAPAAWLVAAFRPRHQPTQTLAASLEAAFAPHLSAHEVRESFRDGLSDLIRDHLPADHGLLLVIDHLEDLIDESPGPEDRARFDAVVAEALEDFDQRLVLVTTHRDDRLAALDAALPRLRAASLANGAHVTLGSLTRPGIVDIVHRPMSMAGRPLDEVLAARIVDDAERVPNAAPLLTSALFILTHGETSTAAYDALGGVSGALPQALDAQIDRLSPDDRARVRQLMLALVEVGRGGLDRAVPLDLNDAVTVAGTGPRGEALIEMLQAGEATQPPAPILWVTDQDTAEGAVARVRLITGALPHLWPALGAWIEADREVLERRTALLEAQARWLSKGKIEDALPGNATTGWMAGDDLPDDQRKRLRGSLTRGGRLFLEAAEASAARRREAADAARMATQEAALQTLASERDRALASKARLRILALCLVAVGCALGGLAFRSGGRVGELESRVRWADDRRGRLRDQLRESQAQFLAAEKERLSAETERRQTERQRRLADREGLMAERSADDVLSFSIQAANKADDFFERIPHPDAKYARQAYAREVETLLEARVSESPDNERLRYLLARQHLFMARISAERQAFRDVRPSYEAAISVMEDLVRAVPEEPDYQEKLADAYERLGRFLARDHRNDAYNDYPTAIDLFGKSVALHAALAADEPDAPAHPLAEAEALAWRGRTHLAASDPTSARADFDQAIALTRQLIERRPKDDDLKDALARRLTDVADLHYAASNWAEAVEVYQEALAIAEALGADEPYEATRKLVRRKLKLARILAR